MLEPATNSANCAAAPLTLGSTRRTSPPATSGAAPSTPRAARVEAPRAIKTCDSQPVVSTTTAPDTHGRIEIQPASFCEKPSPRMMKGVNQVSPSESAQYAPKVAAQQPMKVGDVSRREYGTCSAAAGISALA